MDIAQNQIQQMVAFITAEAQDKAAEIQKKGEEEYSIEVHKLVTEQKDKLRQGYERKVKSIETQYAIAKSTAINKQRLEKIKARQEVMHKIANDVTKTLEQKGNEKAFVTRLIVQGILMLLESEVEVRCREKDVKLVESCLDDASAQYAKVIKAESGATKTCKLSVSKADFVPATSLGGVLLVCGDGKITIDNTIDVRLALAMEQDKPAIRELLFPASR
eukprot:TRINITY_DN12479_c0_g1_i1.p1 TRINITY_DN12479_c0_g1~~TRINITY_DN12479_c0_g1_i1.p1  ORF type:complete len:242 (-),score=53.18 TRINITY_DN12479_c0_g1_i1:110-766(-)